MHELSLVAGLFEILEEKTGPYKPAKIVAVKLRVGRLSGAVPELLVTAFDMYKKGTSAEEAVLEVVEVPVRFRCRSCDQEFEVEDFVFHCSSCQGSDLEMLSGTDLILDKIELETEESSA
jgi:hydrogenase nickel incorporation protein HypA/HybF